MRRIEIMEKEVKELEEGAVAEEKKDEEKEQEQQEAEEEELAAEDEMDAVYESSGLHGAVNQEATNL